MIIIETTLLILAYSVIIISLFLQIICYKRNLEPIETIAFTFSLLLLILAITITPLIGGDYQKDGTNTFVLLAMVLVGFTTFLNVLEERVHNLGLFWKKLLISLSSILFLLVILADFLGFLTSLQYVVAIFTGISIFLSMLLIRRTKPNKRIAHLEKTQQIFALFVGAVVVLSLLANFVFETKNPLVSFTLPLIFILIGGVKSLDDIQRLSLFNLNKGLSEQHFKNYALTPREKEVALLLAEGKTYKVISETLFISLPTVKTHVSNVYRKCDVKNRTELTLLLID